MKYLILITLLLPFMSVAQNNTGESIAAKSDTPKVIYFSSAEESRFFQIGRKMVESCKLPAISKEAFAAKIKEIYDVDINSFPGNYAPLDDRGLTVAVKDGRYIHFAHSSAPDAVVQSDICNYNKMILFSDKAALAYFKASQPYIIAYLIRDYGYVGNKDWLKFALDYFNEFNDPDEVHKLLFSLENGQWRLRKTMLNKVVELQPDLLYQLIGVIELIQREPAYHPDSEETIAYLLNASLQVEISGISQMYVESQPTLVKIWKQHKYYNLKELNQYIEFVYQTPAERYKERNEQGDYYLLEQNSTLRDKSKAHLGKIEDKDGYTNIRQYSNSKTAPVIAKILSSESFYYWPLAGEWWIVEKQNGVRGFVHSSRIREITKKK